jgi:hypothetical protein
VSATDGIEPSLRLSYIGLGSKFIIKFGFVVTKLAFLKIALI